MLYPNNLAECRKRRGLKQYEVAAYLGITVQAYQNFESGRRDAKSDMLRKLKELFQCRWDDLLLSVDVSSDETRLMYYFNALNDEGKKQLLIYSKKNLAHVPEYQK
jgi:transcriptional regulator with XRE-family HTH domain